ncbi:hypothetical protein D018_3718B, partial [Vibrio parahaemolyticus VP2007-007]
TTCLCIAQAQCSKIRSIPCPCGWLVRPLAACLACASSAYQAAYDLAHHQTALLLTS